MTTTTMTMTLIRRQHAPDAGHRCEGVVEGSDVNRPHVPALPRVCSLELPFHFVNEPVVVVRKRPHAPNKHPQAAQEVHGVAHLEREYSHHDDAPSLDVRKEVFDPVNKISVNICHDLLQLEKPSEFQEPNDAQSFDALQGIGVGGVGSKEELNQSKRNPAKAVKHEPPFQVIGGNQLRVEFDDVRVVDVQEVARAKAYHDVKNEHLSKCDTSLAGKKMDVSIERSS